MIVAGLLAVGLVDAVVMIDLHLYGQADRVAPADVIAVLGAGIEDNFQATDAFRRRTAHAVSLWRAGVAPYIICSGGYSGHTPLQEAQSCVDVAVGLGVPRAAVFLEGASRSTEENAIYIQRLMDARGWHSVLLVTDDFHVFRSEYLFGQLGRAGGRHQPGPGQHRAGPPGRIRHFPRQGSDRHRLADLQDDPGAAQYLRAG